MTKPENTPRQEANKQRFLAWVKKRVEELKAERNRSMAVKIIKPGITPEDRVYRHTCSHCQCEFEFHRSDAVYHPDQRDGDYLSINCPTCQWSANVSTKPLPRGGSAAFR